MDNSGKHILLVDDEPVIRETLCSILKDEGYLVSTAETGREAVRLSLQKGFDLAIIDLKLPDIEGMQVLRELKENSPSLCAVLITAYPTTESAIRAIQEEAYEYITKPFDINHVKLVIRRGLEEKQLENENRRLLVNLQSEKEKLETILHMGHVMSSILNLEELARFIVDRICEVLKVRVCSLMLLEEGELVIKAAIGLNELIVRNTHIKPGQSISGWVVEHGEAVLVQDIESDVYFGRTNLPQYETKSLLCLPLKSKSSVLGVINLADKTVAGKLSVFDDQDRQFLSIICTYAAIAIENARLYGEITSLAVTDGLTGLFNHRYFQTRLAEEVDRVQRYRHPLSLIMLDIDSFKKFNDTYGHPLGDKVLKTIARLIKKNVRKVDVPCRYGGEEFSVILPETGIKECLLVAEKIRRSVEEMEFETGKNGPKVRMTISGGATEFQEGVSKAELVQAADDALYRAKSKGKNRILT